MATNPQTNQQIINQQLVTHMKNILATLVLAVALLGTTANAGMTKAAPSTTTVTNVVTVTNYVTAPALTLEDTAAASKGMPMEFTLGASGSSMPSTGESSLGIDVTLSIQPLKLPIWFGIGQGVAWEPSFSGSTDLFADWAWEITDNLNLNTGWSVGALYDTETLGWRSGPEVSLQWYTKGDAFIIVGANYDLVTKASDGGWKSGGSESGFRYFAGIGFAF